ncbi:MAG: HEAT repeat domain-containing protein [Ignavibacteria bacterium]|nr:HEAT repeat domain-containing protein [Ignavibacteria bacterium]
MLDEKKKKKILSFIDKNEYDKLITHLDTFKTAHAGTPKTDIKRFTIKEITKHILQSESSEKKFFDLGKKLCDRKEYVSHEIGISIIWRGYRYNKKETKEILLQIADSENWEVREYAAGAFINVLHKNPDLYKTILQWVKHKSENVRRAVVFSSVVYSDKKDISKLAKAFEILEPLLSDSSVYVKRNLGPCILGSRLGNHHPKEVTAQLWKWMKIKNDYVKWNIAMTFNNSFGIRHPETALLFLKELSKEKSKIVSRAVISTLRHLNKRHKKLIQEFIKKEGIEI